MTDTDEPQASGADYPDAQEPIRDCQKELYKIYPCEKNTRVECSRSRQKNAAPEESSDELNSISASSQVLLDSSDSEIDFTYAGGSDNHPKSSAAPSKQWRSQHSKQQAESVVGVPGNDSSSDSSLSPPSPVKAPETSEKLKSKLNLKAIFAYHFRGKKFKAAAHQNFRSGSRKRRKREKKYEITVMPSGRPPLTASPQEQKRRLQHRGFQFPFVEKYYGKKHIPLKMVLGYEQAAIKGYLQYVEVLKYEEHLKKALKALQASDDLERECLVGRKHKYLDDEGPISPIQEMNDEDGDNLNSDNQEDFDARVVDNSSFIICSKIPSKKKSKPERKCAKSIGVLEIEDEDNCC